MKEKIITIVITVLILFCSLIIFNNLIFSVQPKVTLEQVWQSSGNHQLIRVVMRYQEESFYFTPEWWEENKDKFSKNQINIRWVLLDQ